MTNTTGATAPAQASTLGDTMSTFSIGEKVTLVSESGTMAHEGQTGTVTEVNPPHVNSTGKVTFYGVEIDGDALTLQVPAYNLKPAEHRAFGIAAPSRIIAEIPTPEALTSRAFKPEAAAYAAKLIAAGFTVYAEVAPRRPVLAGWFHYSRPVDGVECFGTFHDGSDGFEGANHSMPIVPSRLNGSSAIIGARWGDAATFDLDNLDPLTVAYAEAVARPSNSCPFNAEPTPEALAAEARAYLAHKGTPQRFYRGAVLANATPWGIGTTYAPVAP